MGTRRRHVSPPPLSPGISSHPDPWLGPHSFLQEGCWALGPTRTCSPSPLSPPREWSAGTMSSAPTEGGTALEKGMMLQGVKNQTTPCPGRWQSSRAGLRAGAEPSPGGLCRKTPEPGLQPAGWPEGPAARSAKDGPGGAVAWEPWPLPSARGSREAPVITLAGGKPTSVRVEHHGRAPEGARTAKGFKDRSGRRGGRAGAGFPHRALARGSGRRALLGGGVSRGVMLPTTLHTTQPALGSLVENARSLKTEARPPSTGPTPATGNDRALRPAGLRGPLGSHSKRRCSLHPSVCKAHCTGPQGWPHRPQVPLSHAFLLLLRPGPRAVVPSLGEAP